MNDIQPDRKISRRQMLADLCAVPLIGAAVTPARAGIADPSVDVAPPSPTARQARLSETEFRALAVRVRNWSRWGADDELGALNHISRGEVRAAGALATAGVVVSCGALVSTRHPAEGPELRLTRVADGGWTAVNDRLTMDVHGHFGTTHLDALAHVSYDGVGFNGRKLASIDNNQAAWGGIDGIRSGIFGRGVLLDLPRALDRPWMEPHEVASLATVRKALAQSGVTLRPGDLVFFRTGSYARYAGTGKAFDLSDMPGVTLDFAEEIHRAKASLLVSDVGMDPTPSEVQAVAIPWHVLCLTQMGVRLVDCADLESLAATCERLKRWSFACSIAPLRIQGGTGSPVSPLCIF